MKVKLFTGTVTNIPGENTQPFEDEINSWLSIQPELSISEIKLSAFPIENTPNKVQVVCLVCYKDPSYFANAS